MRKMHGAKRIHRRILQICPRVSENFQEEAISKLDEDEKN